MTNKEKKKKSRYQLERRQIQLEEQLLDIEQRRLDLEQKRVELQLKKVRLATKKSKQISHSKSAPPLLIGESSACEKASDDESSFQTAPTVSTHETSDLSDTRFPSQRLCGGESDGEETPCSAKAISKPPRRSQPRRPCLSGGASKTVFPTEPMISSGEAEEDFKQSLSKTREEAKAHDGKIQSSGKRAVQNMRNLVSTTKPSSSPSPERSASLRDLLTEHGNDATMTLPDCCNQSCNQSTETYNSGKTKVMSNVTDETKSNLDRGRSYPSLKEDRSSRHNSGRSLATGDLQNGEFVYEWSDGRRYEGSWKDGKVCPSCVVCQSLKCILSLTHPPVFSSVKTQFHGLGVHTWPNGGKYVGQYKVSNDLCLNLLVTRPIRHSSLFNTQNGLKWGYGVYDWSDGSKYEGQFASGKRNGQGAQLNADGSIYHNGLWRDDEPIRNTNLEQGSKLNR